MAILLAIAASFLYAVSAAAEQRAVQRAVARPEPGPHTRRCAPAGARCSARHVPLCGEEGREPGAVALLERVEERVERGVVVVRRVLSSPLWLVGWGIDAAGFGVQAGALHFGSISVVQPLIVTTLLFTLPLSTIGTGRRPSPWAWVGAVAVCAGLGMFMATQRTAGAGAPVPGRLPLMLIVVGVLSGLAVLAARGRSPLVRAGLLATAAGALFSVGAVCTKLVGDQLVHGGVVGALTDWSPYVLVAVSAVGLVVQQAAFAAGPLPAAMTALTITDPVVSYAVGVGGFGESLPGSPGLAALAAVGAVVTIAGVYVLSAVRGTFAR